MAYNHQEIEKKWQDRWETSGIFHAKDNTEKEKFYCLIEFPYPSGAGLHIGHPRSYTALDVLARKRRHQGYNVLYPIGWDAFGLPTENYAIKTGRKPQEITKENTDTFRRQLQSLGLSFDWSREVNTTDPEYYKWTQWMFLELFKAGLAYKDTMPINWCLSCKIGLANEEVVNGACERCGGEVEKRDKEQWMIAITKYADRLLEDLEHVNYLEKIKAQQRNWIGKSEGAEVWFKVDPTPGPVTPYINVFTTRPDTIFGATYLVLAPEHELVEQITTDDRLKEVMAYVKEAKSKSDIERGDASKEKTGVFTGAYAINPATEEKIPIWVADYVLDGYGTGAIMAVPAHDERDHAFAKKFDLGIKGVMAPVGYHVFDRKKFSANAKNRIPQFVNWEDIEQINQVTISFPLTKENLNKFGEFLKKESTIQSEVLFGDIEFIRENSEGFSIKQLLPKPCLTGEGVSINSGEFNGLPTAEMKRKITQWLGEHKHGKATVNYRLRDWIFSRQRYWGEPIPLVKCESCSPETDGWVPVPESDLPIVLPEVEKYEPTDTGESPLAAIEQWVNTTCPTCDGPAKRETDTMPNWAGSSWYFLRYIDPYNNDAFASKEKLDYWMPVDLYNGGMEHTTLHLLYSRFWNKALYDLGHVPVSEPYARRHSHGLVMAEDGTKMSKSKGNVVNPDEIVRDYGADSLRMYILFMGPFEEPVPWSLNGLIGVRRFLDKFMRYVLNWNEEASEDCGKIIEPYLKKISDQIDDFKFNTAVAAFMEMMNNLGGKQVTKEQLKKILVIIGPFAPHMANECWEKIGESGLVEEQPWPEFDENLLIKDEVELGVQVNGKVRGAIKLAPDASEQTAMELAKADQNITKHLVDKEIVKVIYKPSRILNIVVK